MAVILTGVVLGASPGPLPALPRPLLRRACAFAMAAGCFQAVSINLSKHGFNLLEASTNPVTPVEAAYQRLWGGFAAAILIHGAIRWRTRGRLAPPSPKAPFPTSPLPAPAWVTLNALFGPVLGVTCLMWAVSLVRNPWPGSDRRRDRHSPQHPGRPVARGSTPAPHLLSGRHPRPSRGGQGF
jgi:hypothetical protein